MALENKLGDMTRIALYVVPTAWGFVNAQEAKVAGVGGR